VHAHPNRRRRFDEYDIRCVTESHLDVNSNNDDLLLEFFSKTFTWKDHNNTGGCLLIYFTDDISVKRVTGLQSDVDDLDEHAHYFNPSKCYFSFPGEGF
jgi:hypothetical protein